MEMNLVARFQEVFKEFNKLNPMEMQVAVCMLIDKTAKENRTSSVELMDTLRPLIEAVINQMGFDGV